MGGSIGERGVMGGWEIGAQLRLLLPYLWEVNISLSLSITSVPFHTTEHNEIGAQLRLSIELLPLPLRLWPFKYLFDLVPWRLQFPWELESIGGFSGSLSISIGRGTSLSIFTRPWRLLEQLVQEFPSPLGGLGALGEREDFLSAGDLGERVKNSISDS